MSINLPPERNMSEDRMYARQHAIVRYARGAVPRRRTRRLARYAALVVGGSALLIGGTAVGYAAFEKPTVPVEDTTYCYSTATLDDDFRTQTVMATAADGTRRSSSAFEACAAAWRIGLLRLDTEVVGAPPPDGREDHPVPPLAACVLDGVAAVFPGDAGICAELDLPQLLE